MKSSLRLSSLVLLCAASLPGQQVEKPEPEPARMIVELEPIAGLTKHTHEVSGQAPIPLPLGHSLTLRAHVEQEGVILRASFVWHGARELSDSRGRSRAVFRAEKQGLHEVSVMPALASLSVPARKLTIEVVAVRIGDIRLRVTKPDKLITFVGDKIEFRAKTEPPEFARLAEWKAPTYSPSAGLGASFATTRRTPSKSIKGNGGPAISAHLGFTIAKSPGRPVFYKASWVAKPSKRDYFQAVATIRLYHEIRTDPAGLEHLVPWTYDTVGTGTPSATSGTGRTFTLVRTISRRHALRCWRVTAGNLSDSADEPNRDEASPDEQHEDQPPKNQEPDKGDPPCPTAQSLPITYSNGEATLSVVDLYVPSRGFDFVWQRTFTSRSDFKKSLGHNWTHNFDRRVFRIAVSGSVAVADGKGREDTYQVQRLGQTYFSPAGYYDRLTENNDDTFTQVGRDGTTYGYDANGYLVSITDRTGQNTLRLFRNSFSNIVRIVDTQDRVYTLTYTDNTPDQKLASITDFRGRTVRYFYDLNDDLVRVRSPIVFSTPNGNDFLNGKSTLYTYSSGFSDSRLNHNLLTVTEPGYNVGNDPKQSTPMVTLTYSPTLDSLADEFDHVVAERWGNDRGGPPSNPGLKVGGTAMFAYTLSFAHDKEAPAAAVLRVTETTRNGNLRVHYFDQGDLEIRTIVRTNRNIRPGEGDYVTDYTFTAEGLLQSIQKPRGNKVVYLWDETNPRRESQRNRLEIRRQVGKVGGGLVDLVTRFTYEPVFNRVRTVTDPRGFPNGKVPLTSSGHLDLSDTNVARYTTTNVFDYQEGTGFQDARGIPAAEQIPEGLGDQNGAKDFDAGNLVRVDHPKIQTPGPNKGQVIVEKQTFNEHGQVLDSIDPLGRITRNEYYPTNTKAGDPEDREGYLKSVIEDVNGFALQTSYEYDIVGNVTAVIDPKGQRSETIYNQLDQVVRAFSRPVKANGVRYQTDSFYDANDNLVRTLTLNLDENGKPYAHGVIDDRAEFDILHNLVATEQDKTRDDGTGGGRVRTEYFYDAHTNLIAVKKPKPVLEPNRAATISTTLRDERELPYKVTLGDNDTDPFNKPPANAVVATWNYDENGNLLEAVDTIKQVQRKQASTRFPGSAPGDVTQMAYDGFDRRIQMTDGEGNLDQVQYDLASNPTRTRRVGPADHTSTAPVRALHQTDTVFDEMNRVVKTDRLHVDEGGLFVGDGKSTTTFEYDTENKLVKVTDDRGLTTTTVWDTADRESKVIGELGNEVETRYDRNGNVTTTIQRDKSSDFSSPVDTYISAFAYDGLDRLVRSVDPAMDIVETFYDSRSNAVRTSDGVRGSGNTGNIVLYRYDALDRLVETERKLTTTGRGDGAALGSIVTKSQYDDDSLLVSDTDHNNNTTSYRYDSVGRMVELVYADNSKRRTTYNTDNQVTSWTDPNGTTCRMTYDGMSRLTRRDVTRGTGVLATTKELFHYDGASRTTLVENDDIFSSNLMSCRFAWDSLDSRTLDQQGTHAVRSTYDGMANRVTCSYPGDFASSGRRTLTSAYDKLNRLQSISDAAGRIVTNHYKGPGRLEQREYGATTSPVSKLDCGYDAMPRLVDMVHETGSKQLIAGFQYGYDREHNRLFEKRTHQSNRGDVYAYDSIYRAADNKQNVDLTAVSAGQEIKPENFSSGDRLQYSYDGVGNRTQVVSTVATVATTTTYTLGAANLYASIKVGNQAARNFQYDNNWSMKADGRHEYSYDFKNRIVEVRDQTTKAVRVRYSYDAVDRRAMKVVNPTSQTPSATVYVFDGDQVVEERDRNDALLRQHVWGNGTDELCQQKVGSQTSKTFYAHENSIGSITALVDGTGKIVERYSYDPFGNTSVALDGKTGNEYRFHSARFDPETGLYCMRARYYQPSLGRFVQRDPIGIWTDIPHVGNGFTFVRNDPINHIDPTGQDVWVAENWWGHMNINVGDPKGKYNSFSFGLDFRFQYDGPFTLKYGPTGNVGYDTRKNLKIDMTRYYRTDKYTDSIIEQYLFNLRGQPNTYWASWTCRQWSRDQYEQISEWLDWRQRRPRSSPRPWRPKVHLF